VAKYRDGLALKGMFLFDGDEGKEKGREK